MNYGECCKAHCLLLNQVWSVQAVSMGGLEEACKTTPSLHTDTLGIVIHIGPPAATLHKNAQLH